MKFITLTLSLVFAFAGCASLKSAYSTPEKRKAIGDALWNDAISIVGSVAVNSLANIVQQEVSGGNVDFAHTAAQAAWGATSAASLAKLINDATGGTMPALADKAAAVVSQAVQHGISTGDALNAVASIISSVAITP